MLSYSDVFKSLSEKTRLRILFLLIRSNKEICVCEMVYSLKEPQCNVSRHLKYLKYSGLIKEKKIGRWRYYSLIKKGNAFLNNIFETIKSISEKDMENDYVRLQKLLKIRNKDTC